MLETGRDGLAETASTRRSQPPRHQHFAN